MKEIDRRIAAAYIVSRDGKLLLGRKDPAKGGVYPDCWHTPGGGVDDGETDDQAICREVLEETGLDISNAQKYLVDDQGSGEAIKKSPTGEEILVKMQFNIFKVQLTTTAAETKIIEGDDLINFTWFDLDKLNTIKLTPPSDKLFVRHGTAWLSVS